jgi:hypothetical protein
VPNTGVVAALEDAARRGVLGPEMQAYMREWDRQRLMFGEWLNFTPSGVTPSEADREIRPTDE